MLHLLPEPADKLLCSAFLLCSRGQVPWQIGTSSAVSHVQHTVGSRAPGRWGCGGEATHAGQWPSVLGAKTGPAEQHCVWASGWNYPVTGQQGTGLQEIACGQSTECSCLPAHWVTAACNGEGTARGASISIRIPESGPLSWAWGSRRRPETHR